MGLGKLSGMKGEYYKYLELKKDGLKPLSFSSFRLKMKEGMSFEDILKYKHFTNKKYIVNIYREYLKKRKHNPLSYACFYDKYKRGDKLEDILKYNKKINKEFNSSEINHIKRLRNEFGLKYKELAEKYGVCISTIFNLIYNK